MPPQVRRHYVGDRVVAVEGPGPERHARLSEFNIDLGHIITREHEAVDPKDAAKRTLRAVEEGKVKSVEGPDVRVRPEEPSHDMAIMETMAGSHTTGRGPQRRLGAALGMPMGREIAPRACYVIAGRRTMRGKITKRAVDAIAAGQSDVFLWDTEIKGFGLKVTPAGSKVYVLQYRTGGRGTLTKRATIGRHGTLTPEQARVAAGRMAGVIANGADPAAVRAAEKGAPTVADLAARFLSEHVATKSKPRTAAEYRRLLDKIILPALGRRRVRDVTRADAVRLHHEYRGVPYEANRVLAVLSRLMNLAEKWGERPDGSNPCRHVEKYRERPRERFLSEAEMARLGNALADAERGQSEGPFVVAAIRLLAFTGARLSEMLTLKWEHVDFERACLRLPESKTGPKVVHLNPPALELISSLPRIEGNPYVIPGKRVGGHLVNLGRPWRRIRTRAGLADVRLHDLRHSFASAGAGAGLGLPILGALLGHVRAATTQRYAHLAADPLKRASDLIGGRIATAMGDGKGQAADVVPMKRQH